MPRASVLLLAGSLLAALAAIFWPQLQAALMVALSSRHGSSSWGRLARNSSGGSAAGRGDGAPRACPLVSVCVCVWGGGA
jgi:hypothetical protein